MKITRRDFMKATSAVGAALGLTGTGLLWLPKALGAAAPGKPPVVWLHGQSCTGCSVSLLNSIYYTTIDKLLTDTIDLKFHSTVMAGAGIPAVTNVKQIMDAGNFILVLEGAIPTADGGRACTIWPGMTIYNAIKTYGPKAKYALAVGTCAAYGGMAAGSPNPTGAVGLSKVLGNGVVNIPGCPVHPDWVVGTVAYVLKYGAAPTLDSKGRPTDYYASTTHANCKWLSSYVGPGHHSGGKPCTICHGSHNNHEDHGNIGTNYVIAGKLSDQGCLFGLGCKGPLAHCDCSTRRWNGAAANRPGVNYCIEAGGPCIGCTEPNYPDAMSPFYRMFTTAAVGSGGGTGGGTGTTNCSPCHTDGRTGPLPANHPAIGGGTTGGGTTGGGTTGGGAVDCSRCHSTNRSGALPPGHPSVTSGSTRRTSNEHDDEGDD